MATAIQTFLVPVDFSAESERAARMAISLAGMRNARVEVIHIYAVPDNISATVVEPMYVPPAVTDAVGRARGERVDHELAEFMAGLPSYPLLSSATRIASHTDAGIVGVARDHGASLIVMGSHGRGASRLLLGSVAESVCQKAPCPVLITRGEKQDVPKGFGQIIVAVDYSAASGKSVAVAAEFRQKGGAFELLHVWDADAGRDPEWFSSAEASGEYAARRSQEALALSEFGAEFTAIKGLRTYVGIGNPAREILERARETHADLIVMGAHAHERVSERLLGTIAERVLRKAQVSVLLVPRDRVAGAGTRVPADSQESRVTQ